jgi:hypothetical protein
MSNGWQSIDTLPETNGRLVMMTGAKLAVHLSSFKLPNGWPVAIRSDLRGRAREAFQKAGATHWQYGPTAAGLGEIA